MRCQRCGNREKDLFFVNKDMYVCRKCLMYKDTKLEDSYQHGDGRYTLNYSLTSEQKKASKFILDEIIGKRDCILNAVTGAGKSEIIYDLISYCVSRRLKIGIVIPRKDVVIELYNRIKQDFKNTSIVKVYGGCHEALVADIVILTSHQLYRYNNFFDVVVIDEVDAFPFYKNDLLNNFLKRSVKGNIVYMSATIPKEYLKKGLNIYYLNRRYHGEKLDIPKVRYLFHNYRIKKFISVNKDCLNILYFPTIKLQMKMARKIKVPYYLINSKTINRQELLKAIHGLSKGVVLSTLVLERGVTFKNVNVLVYLADHKLFSKENLVQIAGRVGRKADYPHGKILFLVNNKNKAVREAIRFIKKCNE